MSDLRAIIAGARKQSSVGSIADAIAVARRSVPVASEGPKYSPVGPSIPVETEGVEPTENDSGDGAATVHGQADPVRALESAAGAFAKHGANELLLGTAPKLGGLLDAVVEKLSPSPVKSSDLDEIAPPPSPVDAAYKKGRDRIQSELDAASKEHPGPSLAGGLTGALMLPLPGPGKAKGAAKVAGMIGQGIGYGTLSAMGHSRPTQNAAGEGLRGGVIGGVAGGLGAAASEGLERLGTYFGGNVAKAEADNLAMAGKTVDDAIASQAGAHGSAVQQGSRSLENMIRESEALPAGHPLKQQLADFLASPEGMKLREGVASNTLDRAPGLLDKADVQRKMLEELQSSRDTDIATKAAENMSLAPPVKKFGRYLFDKFAVPVVGGAVAGPAGALLGSVGGSRPGTAAADFMLKPIIRKSVFSALQTLVTTPGAAAATVLGKYEPFLRAEFDRHGEAGLLSASRALDSLNDPDWEERKKQIAAEAAQ